MQTITVPAKTFEKIVSKLDYLSQEIENIKTQLSSKEPPYGSSEWWEWSNTKALQEVRAGKGTVLHNKKELKEFFRNLRNE